MALQDVQRLVAGYMPRIEPFQANTQVSKSAFLEPTLQSYPQNSH